MPGVTVAYEAQPDSLKETISLVNSQVQSTFTYQLKLPAGWTAKSNGRGGADLVDGKGNLQAALVTPTMKDAARKSGGANMTISSVGSQVTIIVAADKAWINAPGRVFPVVIDPTIWTNTNYY